MTTRRYPSHCTMTFFLETVRIDPESYSARQIESARSYLWELEAELRRHKTALDSLEDERIFELYIGGDSSSWHVTKRTVSKTTEKFIWLEPMYEGDKQVRLEKEPVLAGEFVRPRKKKWWTSEFGFGAALRQPLEGKVRRATQLVDECRNGLQQKLDAVSDGYPALSQEVWDTLLHIEDCLAEGKEPPTVDWRKFGL